MLPEEQPGRVRGPRLERHHHSEPERRSCAVYRAHEQQPANTGVGHEGSEGPPSLALRVPLPGNSQRRVPAPAQLQLLPGGVLWKLPIVQRRRWRTQPVEAERRGAAWEAWAQGGPGWAVARPSAGSHGGAATVCCLPSMAAAWLPCYRFAWGRCGAGLGYPVVWLPPGCHVITLSRVTVVPARAIPFGRAGPAGRPHR